MQLETLLAPKTENDTYCELFKNGEETALNYVYRHVYSALLHHGLRLINDRFVAENLVHEAILKCWQFREQMESMRHIYCFMRLVLRWKCLAHYKKPVNRFHRGFQYAGCDEDFVHIEEKTESGSLHAEQIRLVEEALPYLPASRHRMVTLYFHHGMNYKAIARRFNASHQTVHSELQKSFDLLRKIIHAKSKLDTAAHHSAPHVIPRDTGAMNAEKKEICRLRYEARQSFAAIAASMNLPQAYVQQQYVKAQQQLNASKAAIA